MVTQVKVQNDLEKCRILGVTLLSKQHCNNFVMFINVCSIVNYDHNEISEQELFPFREGYGMH